MCTGVQVPPRWILCTYTNRGYSGRGVLAAVTCSPYLVGKSAVPFGWPHCVRFHAETGGRRGRTSAPLLAEAASTTVRRVAFIFEAKRFGEDMLQLFKPIHNVSSSTYGGILLLPV